MATRRRRTTSRTSSRAGTTRRRTTRPRSTPRRRRSTAASFGGAFGLLLVWVLLQAPWWLKTVAVVLAVAGFAGYVLLTRRDAPDTDAPTDPAPSGGTTP